MWTKSPWTYLCVEAASLDHGDLVGTNPLAQLAQTVSSSVSRVQTGGPPRDSSRHESTSHSLSKGEQRFRTHPQLCAQVLQCCDVQQHQDAPTPLVPAVHCHPAISQSGEEEIRRVCEAEDGTAVWGD